MKSDTALNNATLELTQKIQLHFPRDIDPEVLRLWNGCSKETITAVLTQTFGKIPASAAKPELPLLVSRGAIGVGVTKAPFVVSEKFTEANGIWTSQTFRDEFFGIVEEPFAGSTLNCGTLSRWTADDQIITRLGGKIAAEITLTEMFTVLSELRKCSEKGWLLFYVKNKKGSLCVVRVHWEDDGWHMFASFVTSRRVWMAGSIIFFH